jgi:hypothetical protein
MQTNSPDQEIDRGYLTDLVQKALDRPGLQVTSWKAQPIHGGLEWDSAVFRVQGEAGDGGETIPWSLILKAVKPADKARDPAGIWYWKREALAYQSGLLHHLPGGNVTAPTCYAVEERPDGSLRLWLEDVKDDIGSPWPVEQYAVVAHHLGQFNGAYLTGQAFPSEPWVTRNWLRMYVVHAAEMVEFIHRNPNHPIVMHIFPGNTLAQMLAVWDEHNQILDMLENLPQVFCHQDAFRRNLFARKGKTIAIDWGYMGMAPVGAELVALVAGSIGFFEVPVDRVDELDRICFENYLQGLRDAGWEGDLKLVRAGYVVSLLLRYPIGGSIGEMLPKFLDQASRAKVESAFSDKSASEIEQTDPALAAYYQARIPEALKLMGMKRLIPILSRIGVNMIRLRLQRKKRS